jgi:hypothetical protein
MYNSLLGILLRFRKEAFAITVDIEQMFHNFRVTEDHRRFLRFLWHEHNDIQKPLIDYQMAVHANIGKYQHSVSGDSLGAISACWRLNNFFINSNTCSYFTGLLRKFMSNDFALRSTVSRLFVKISRFGLKGRGAFQWSHMHSVYL